MRASHQKPHAGPEALAISATVAWLRRLAQMAAALGYQAGSSELRSRLALSTPDELADVALIECLAASKGDVGTAIPETRVWRHVRDTFDASAAETVARSGGAQRIRRRSTSRPDREERS